MSILNYLQWLWKIWWNPHSRYDFICKSIAMFLFQCVFYCEPMAYFIFNNDVLQTYNKNLKLVYALNPKPFATWFFHVFFSIWHVTCSSTIICKKYVELYCNNFGCHLVFGFIVVSFFCFHGGDHNHVGWLKFMFLGVFKVHRGLRFQVS